MSQKKTHVPHSRHAPGTSAPLFDAKLQRPTDEKDACSCLTSSISRLSSLVFDGARRRRRNQELQIAPHSTRTPMSSCQNNVAVSASKFGCGRSDLSFCKLNHNNNNNESKRSRSFYSGRLFRRQSKRLTRLLDLHY